MDSVKFFVRSYWIVPVVLIALCPHTCCYHLNVRRSEEDIFWPLSSTTKCADYCTKRNAFFSPSSNRSCTCKCSYKHSTFEKASLKCVANTYIRGTDQLKFKLEDRYKQATAPVEVITFSSNVTKIKFYVKKNKFKCMVNRIETLSDVYSGQWIMENSHHWKATFHQLDDDDGTGGDKDEDWIELKIDWKVNANVFSGRVMRINMTCNGTREKVMGVLAFKVNGEFTVDVPDGSLSSTKMVSTMSPSSEILFPTPSISMSVSSSSIVDVPDGSLFSTKMVSTMSPSSEILFPTPSVSMSVSSSSMILSLLPSFYTSISTESFGSVSDVVSSTYSTLPMMVTRSMTVSTSGSSKSSTFFVGTTSGYEAQSSTILLMSSTVASSSKAVSIPVKDSESSSTAVITGGVVGGLIALLLIILILAYISRKRKLNKRRRKHSDLGQINPKYPSVTSLTALHNPLGHVAVYENPEVLDDGKRRSGVKSIDSPAYDAFLIVENPSARDVKSVYENMPEPADRLYKELDPDKREPPSKYESLVKNEPEYSTVADCCAAESPYAEVKSDGIPELNGGPKARSSLPQTSEKTSTHDVVEPIYNELENDPDASKSDENPGQMYNVLEESDGVIDRHSEATYSVLEEK